MRKKNEKLNPKYVALLKNTYEKFSKIDVINSSFRKESLLECMSEIKPLSSSSSKSTKLSSQENKIITKKTQNLSTTQSNNDQKMKRYHKFLSRTNVNGRKSYSSEEDEFLLDYLKANPEYDFNKTKVVHKLEKIMKRTPASIKLRIYCLQRGKINKKSKKLFSFTEDKMIIDEAIKHLMNCKSLRDTVIQNPHEFSQQLNRNFSAVEQRWSVAIRSWLLQYYNKNLNLEIRPMLADLVCRNFNSVKSIDWEIVAKTSEFSGHTAVSLRHVFYSKTLNNAARFFNKPTNKVILEEINSYAKDQFINKNIKITSELEKRQLSCIEYFENRTKKLKICFDIN